MDAEVGEEERNFSGAMQRGWPFPFVQSSYIFGENYHSTCPSHATTGASKYNYCLCEIDRSSVAPLNSSIQYIFGKHS